MAADMRHLARRGGGSTWFVVLSVPRSLRAVLGKSNLVRSLGTTSIHLARARRETVLREFRAMIDAARVPGERRNLTEAAMTWRQTFASIEAGKAAGFDDGRPEGADPKAWARFAAGNVVEEAADDVATEFGPNAAREFLGIASGSATPIGLYVDAYLAEGGRKGPLNPRTATQYRANLRALEAWLLGQGVSTLEAVTKTVAGRWVTETMIAKGEQWATSNRRIAAAASYWKWLEKRGHVSGTPWAGQFRSKGSAAHRTGQQPRRQFTATELIALLTGGADAEMADAMRVAALSGMRLEEIYRLTVADCAGNTFFIRQAKSAAGVRRVPIHSALAAIVARRVSDKALSAFLFHEAGPAKAGRERSHGMSQRFGDYRQSIGVEDKAEGARHSRITFHSFRHWFATTAINAGQSREVVGAVLGHAARDITTGVYLAGFSDNLLRACVEAVQLPEVASAVPAVARVARGRPRKGAGAAP